MKVLLICNYKPGRGGISGQVELLQRHLRADGHQADIFNAKALPLRRMLMPWKLERLAKDYDVLHIHCCSGWGFFPAVLGISTGRRLGKRTVVTYHGGGAEKFFASHTKLVQKYLTHSDANIVLNGFLASVFAKYHLFYTAIPNITDAEGVIYRKRTRLEPNYICIRAHETIYNIPCILRAFHHVQQGIPNATLTLVGSGSQHEQLMRQAHEMGLRNVIFTGRVDNKDIYHLLDKADVMLSAPTVDNMPMSLLEGMNAGLLIISSNVGGVPYMVKKSQNGLLFTSDDDKRLSELMLWAMKNQTIACTLADRGHRTAEDYRWEHISGQLYSIYNQ